MASKQLRPVDLAIKRFGLSARQLSLALGGSESLVSQWVFKKGIIPQGQQEKLLRLAQRRGVKLTALEVISGGVP